MAADLSQVTAQANSEKQDYEKSRKEDSVDALSNLHEVAMGYWVPHAQALQNDKRLFDANEEEVDLIFNAGSLSTTTEKAFKNLVTYVHMDDVNVESE